MLFEEQKIFLITQRHYDLIINQAQKCYPEETGGILGGRGNEILCLFPIINKQYEKRKSQFGLDSEDIERGHIFLKKHRMSYFGIYHTHPKGVAYPSDADLSHNQKYLFIISLADNVQPDFRAYEVTKKKPVSIPIITRPNDGITIIDIVSGKPMLATIAIEPERLQLEEQINAMAENRIRYQVEPPPSRFSSSSFTTKA